MANKVFTKADALNLYRGLNGLVNLSGVKFTYGVARNLNLLKPEVEALEKALSPSEEFSKIDLQREEKLKEFARKDKDGKPVIDKLKMTYELEDEAAWDKEFKKFRKVNETAYEARDKQIAEYTELLKTPSTVNLFKIKLNEIPESITTQQMAQIFDLVDDAI